jgi:adenosylcobinamide-phosphate guanylyltransferase
MCGGRGTRLDLDAEKPLVEVGGVPMVDRVIRALTRSRIEDVRAVVSPRVPETRAHLRTVGVDVVETPGEGYVADLDRAVERVGRPALSVAADLPLLSPVPLNRLLAVARGVEGSLAAHVPVALKRRLGVSADTTVEVEGRRLAPAGVNVVGRGPDEIYVCADPRLAVNVNRPGDLRVAEALS